MKWYMHVLQNYLTFSGRASRSEYWFFTLFNTLIAIALFCLTFISSYLAAIYFVYSLAVLIPGLAVTIRRLHDTGRSGFWLFIVLVPLFGALAFLYFMIQGSKGSNEYGSSAASV